jgi:hypothetical protein
MANEWIASPTIWTTVHITYFSTRKNSKYSGQNTQSTKTQSNLEEQVFLGGDQSRASNKMVYPSSAVQKTQKSQSSPSKQPSKMPLKQTHGKSVQSKKEKTAFSTRNNDQDADNLADSPALQAPKK